MSGCTTNNIVLVTVYTVVLLLTYLYFNNLTTDEISNIENLEMKQTYLRTEYPSIAEKAKQYPNILEKLDSNEEDSSFVDKRVNGTLLRTSFSLVDKKAKKFSSVRPQMLNMNIQLPTQFDGREVWREYLSPITDQGICGNCWAHASSAVLADRFAILSLGEIKFNPSPYDMTVCGAYKVPNVQDKKAKGMTLNDISEEDLKLMDDYFHGRKVNEENRSRNEPQTAACEGADLYTTAEVLYTEGVTDIECFPSTVKTETGKIININRINPGESYKLPYCYSLTSKQFDTCPNKNVAMRKYRAKTIYNIGTENDSLDILERAIMHEVYRNGPLTVGFMTFNDFMTTYNGKTIYEYNKDTSGEFTGGHAVRLVGWGEEIVNGRLVPYWWIANSWGSDWGINGYFRIRRKTPQFELERNTIGFLPDFPGMNLIDRNIIPVETSNEIDIRNFIHSYMDPTSGFYTSAMNKVSECKLAGDITNYMNTSQFPYPDYGTFYAGRIKEYLRSNPLPQIDPPSQIVKCGDEKKQVQSIEIREGRRDDDKLPTPSPSNDEDKPAFKNQVINTVYVILIILCIITGMYVFLRK